jgi:hypothetical protein
MSRPTVKTIARARLLLMEARSDSYKSTGLSRESCINLALDYAKDDPYIATELAAYECSHPELVAAIRLRRLGKTAGGEA